MVWLCDSQAFYVDRVVHCTRDVPRRFPIVRGWDSDKLRNRQRNEINSGGFGNGHVDPIFYHKMKCISKKIAETPEGIAQKPVGITDNIAGVSAQQDVPSGGSVQMKERHLSESEIYTHKLIATFRIMADSISDTIIMINDAPTQIHDDECFKVAVEAARHLLGVTPPAVSTICGPAISCSQAEMEEVWKNPVWLEAIEKMCSAMDARTTLTQPNAAPSFSLGLTQMLNTQSAMDARTSLTQPIAAPSFSLGLTQMLNTQSPTIENEVHINWFCKDYT